MAAAPLLSCGCVVLPSGVLSGATAANPVRRLDADDLWRPVAAAKAPLDGLPDVGAVNAVAVVDDLRMDAVDNLIDFALAGPVFVQDARVDLRQPFQPEQDQRQNPGILGQPDWAEQRLGYEVE